MGLSCRMVLLDSERCSDVPAEGNTWHWRSRQDIATNTCETRNCLTGGVLLRPSQSPAMARVRFFRPGCRWLLQPPARTPSLNSFQGDSFVISLISLLLSKRAQSSSSTPGFILHTNPFSGRSFLIFQLHIISPNNTLPGRRGWHPLLFHHCGYDVFNNLPDL